MKALETEIQEKVLCHALDMFSLWATNFTGELPKTVTEVFKKGLDLKSATPSVRVCYLQWLLACLENASMPGGVDLSHALIKTVEKASQNPTQIPLVSEAVCAIAFYLKLKMPALNHNPSCNHSGT